MLGIFGRRKQREAELFASFARASAEGYKRAAVNTAAGTIGATFESDPDNTQYCINAIAAITSAVMLRAGCDLHKLSREDISNGGLFAFVFASHLSAFVGCQFEIASSTVLIPLFGRAMPLEQMGGLMRATGELYNGLIGTGMVTDIGQRFAEWINEPTPEKFERVVESYQFFQRACARAAANRG